MKHHNLYRLVLIGYWFGGSLLALMFICALIGILTGSDNAEGLAWFLGSIGGVITAIAAGMHAITIEEHKELKPLPPEVRRKIEREAQNRRADRELERSLEEVDDQTQAIEGRVFTRQEVEWNGTTWVVRR